MVVLCGFVCFVYIISLLERFLGKSGIWCLFGAKMCFLSGFGRIWGSGRDLVPGRDLAGFWQGSGSVWHGFEVSDRDLTVSGHRNSKKTRKKVLL